MEKLRRQDANSSTRFRIRLVSSYQEPLSHKIAEVNRVAKLRSWKARGHNKIINTLTSIGHVFFVIHVFVRFWVSSNSFRTVSNIRNRYTVSNSNCIIIRRDSRWKNSPNKQSILYYGVGAQQAIKMLRRYIHAKRRHFSYRSSFSSSFSLLLNDLRYFNIYVSLTFSRVTFYPNSFYEPTLKGCSLLILSRSIHRFT